MKSVVTLSNYAPKKGKTSVMKKLNHQYIFLFLWMLFSAIFCMEAIHLNVGTRRRPGPGFMPLLIGIFMFLVALFTLFKNLLGSTETDGKVRLDISLKTLRKPIAIYAALLTYGLILTRLGYLISTTFLMLFLFKVEPQKWFIALISTILTVGISYLIFVVWLECQVPSFPK